MATFKLALGAGHGINTAGKRCLKSLDPNETPEWVLNDRIADKVENILAGYSGVEVLRLDDSDDGAADIALAARVKNANDWGADFYLSIHHNAGIKGGNGGGIVAYCYGGGSKASFEWRDELYEALIEHTGLRGNRANPKTTASHYVTRRTDMPSVLLELGFMDSATDVPIILTDEYAHSCAEAIVEVVAQRWDLKKRVEDMPMTQEQFDAMMEDWLNRRGGLPASAWSKMAEAKAAGITDGTRPQSFATREEVATMIVSSKGE